MYRNMTVGSLPLGRSRRLLALSSSLLLACLVVLSGGMPLQAQTTGGGVQGTVTDPSGAAVAKAQVTATNTETGVATTRQTTSSGTYSISPLQVGTYNIEVVAKGFQRLLQENVEVDNASMFGYNAKLTIGGENTTVTVTDAPPYMNTTDSSLGGTIENELYSQLPLSMSGGPRDPTAFQYLMPGVQEAPSNATDAGTTAGSSGIYGGTGQTGLNENYVEGVPVTNISSGGDGKAVATSVSVDAVDQFSVQTSNASTSFGGAGVSNYTLKSGGNQFHGSAVDYIRNTMFDTWGYFAKVPSSTGFAEKPGEHQNQYDISVGGPILRDKLFFFADYSGFHYTKISNTPQYITIATMANRQGDFTDEYGTQTAGISDASAGTSRTAFQGLQNGVPTYNVMDPSKISSISQYLQKALPTPTNLSIQSNYLAGLPLENSDYSIDVKLDYTINARNKFSLVGVGGNVGFGGQPNYAGSYNQLPFPYASGTYVNQKTSSGILSYTYVASQSLINALKYGYTRNWGEGFSLTQGTPYNSTAAGINNLPKGNASDSMPQVKFVQNSGSNITAPTNWGSKSNTGPVATNTYTIIDNLQWIKGRHNFTFGAQVQWLETNAASYGGTSDTLSLSYSTLGTGNFAPGAGGASAFVNGSAYASFLIGAVQSGSVSAQTISDVGGRYRPMAPYIQDSWQFSPKLTLNLGFRYDYLQPYHEVKNRISFLNSTIINPIVGVPGVMEYAGFPDPAQFPDTATFNTYSPYICHCTTPVHPYNKNFEPRVGFSYAYSPTTVFSGGFSIQLTHAGGSGGGDGKYATAGSGNNGEFGATTTIAVSGNSTAPPAFFLNPSIQGAPANSTDYPPIQGSQPVGTSIPCVAAGTCSPFSAFPPWTVPGVTVNPLQTTGNYNYGVTNKYGCSTSDSAHCTPKTINFADPYYGGRGPQFISYNFGIQKMINKKANLSINYAGSQTHFLPGGSGRGYAINTYSPDYGPLLQTALTGSATSFVGTPTQLNNFPNYKLPWADFTGPSATLGQSLVPFPQFAGPNTGITDLWGSTGNANSNSLQIMVVQRPWHNLSGFVNYSRSKEIDNTGNHRTQFPVGPQDGNFTGYMSANRVDRGLGKYNQTNAFNLTWIYGLPFGRGQAFFSTNRIAGLITGGWQFSGLYKYRDGYPLQITNGTSCNSGSYGGQGTCMPDYAVGFDKRRARINGRWGRGPGSNASNVSNIAYLNKLAFTCPNSPMTRPSDTCGTLGVENSYTLGNIARSGADGLTGPGWWDIDMGIRRTFNIRETATLHLSFQFEADMSNVTNSTFYNLASSAWNMSSTATYGEISGQNNNVPPRDIQFAGRLRF